MTTLPAVAVIDALDPRGPWSTPPGIKWVNDILIDGGKVAGVLTATQSVRGRLTGLTLGLGINVAATPAVQATPFVPAARNLAECCSGSDDGAPTLGGVLLRCLEAISRRLDSVRLHGPDSLIQTYRNNSLILGRAVAIWPDHSNPDATTPGPIEPLAIGVVRAIGSDLSLTLEGHPEPIRCGRLAFHSD